MANIAFRKLPEESIENASNATDGNITDYDYHHGFAYFYWPNTLTIDLGEERTIKYIRILLWDGLGAAATQPKARTYFYRLLASVDHNRWHVLFDTSNDGSVGWQVFNVLGNYVTRYVRIHGLWNSANTEFHVVQFEIHDDDPPELAADIRVQRTIQNLQTTTEIGDGTPVSQRVHQIIRSVDDLIQSSNLLNPEPFRELMSRLRLQVRDIGAIESSVDSIRREILSPVKMELEKGTKVGRYSLWGFWVGIIGGILAIISLIQTVVLRR